MARFLHLKWIEPVCDGINETSHSVLSNFEASVLALSKKYAVSYQQINRDMASANDELSELVSRLAGDEFTIKGLKELIRG